MLMLISPAKSLDFDSPLATQHFTEPDFLPQSRQLIERMRELSPPELEKLMNISNKLANLNYGRVLDWHTPFTPDNARQAVLAFTGDVYQGLAANNFSQADFAFAQQHLRILSGLYGLLRPLDLIQPYRLEMGTSLSNPQGKNLYSFWQTTLTDALQQLLDQQKEPVLLNLASNEYFKAVNGKQLQSRIVSPVFKDWKNGQYKIISFYAKKARGMMAAWVIKNRIEEVEKIRDFDSQGYYFCSQQSDAQSPVFLRDHAA